MDGTRNGSLMKLLRTLYLRIRLARVRQKLGARLEAMDEDLESVSRFSERIFDNGRALEDLRKEELEIMGALNVNDAQPIT